MRYRVLPLLLLISCVGRSQGGQPVSELLKGFERASMFFYQFDWAKALVAAHDVSVLPKLEPWLTHKDRLARANAAFVFAGLGDPRGFETIVAILNDRSYSGIEGGYAAGEVLRQGRYFAAHLLGDLKDPRAVPILIKFLNDPDVNYIVPWSLGQIGDRSAIPSLIGALSDRNPSMRVLAIYALEQLNATQALPRLEDLLNDSEKSTFDRGVPVSEAARDAIMKLESLPSSPARK
jgi:HEAT repeat protein